jgi:hypothetical protein
VVDYTKEQQLQCSILILHVQVYPRPTIAVFSTGDELVQPATATLSRGQVISALPNFLHPSIFFAFSILSNKRSSLLETKIADS